MIGRAAAAQTAFQLIADGLSPAAGKQRVETGGQALAVEPRQHRPPPLGQNRSDPQTPVQESAVGRQVGHQLERCIRVELFDGTGRSGQNLPQRACHPRIDVLDVAILLQIMDRHGQCPEPCRRRQRLQMGGCCLFDTRAGRDQVQQQALDPQDRLQPRPPQVGGAHQILLGARETAALAALIGGLEKADRLQVEDAVVVGGAPERRAERLLGTPVGIARVVQARQLQPRLGGVGIARGQLVQDTAQPRFVSRRVPAQQIEQKVIAAGGLRVGLQAGQQQVDQHQVRVLGRAAEQGGDRLRRVGVEGAQVDSRRGTAARERFQHAGAGQRLIGGAGERHGQVVQVSHRGARIPDLVGVAVLEQQSGLRDDAFEMLFRDGPCSGVEESGYRHRALECRPRHDHQQVDPRRQRILGVDGIREADQVPFNLMRIAAQQRLAQLGCRRRGQRAVGAERLLDRGRTWPLAAARAALELGNRAAQRELLRQQVGGALQAAIVARGIAHHRFAECPPRGERRPPRDAFQQT